MRSAGPAPAEAAANGLGRGFRTLRIAPGKGTEATSRSSVEPALGFNACGIAVISFKPIPHCRIQNGSDGNLAEAGFAFQAGFKIGRQSPAIDFCFHELQCSA